MSMINVGDLATYARGFRDRSRMSWGAVFAGAVVTVATILLLNLLGAALGAGSVRPLDATSADVSRYGTAAGIWEIINLALFGRNCSDMQSKPSDRCAVKTTWHRLAEVQRPYYGTVYISSVTPISMNWTEIWTPTLRTLRLANC